MLHIAGDDKFCPPEAQAQIHALSIEIRSSRFTIIPVANTRSAASAANTTTQPPPSSRTCARSSSSSPSRRRRPRSAQQTLSARWDDHVKYEFATRNTDDTLETMVADAYVNHVPVMTGGVGHDELREFYSKRFIPQMPPDTA